MQTREPLRHSTSQALPHDQLRSSGSVARDSDIEFRKEKALLQQKIQLLNMQLQDSQEREENTKRMHATMLNAFKNDDDQLNSRDDENVHQIITDYEQKIGDLTNTNSNLIDKLSQLVEKSRLGVNYSNDSLNEEFESSKRNFGDMKLENRETRYKSDSSNEFDLESSPNNFNTGRPNDYHDLKKQFEKSLSDATDFHQQEKIMLIDKLETKQTFTFGDRSRHNQDSELQSQYSLKDEIDKLNFIIEEKEFMNMELRQEIERLRTQVSQFHHNSNSEREYGGDSHDTRGLAYLRMENKRLENDLRNTEDNLNEQCLLYKQKLNDERQRTIEVKEEMTNMRINYSNKINNLMQQLSDKDEEISKYKGEGRESMIFQRSSIGKSPDDTHIIEHSLSHSHNRSLTPTGSVFMHSHNNSSQINNNMILDSMGDSVRSSLAFNNLRASTSAHSIQDGASRIE